METKKYIIEIPDNTAWLQWVKVSDKDGHVCFDFKDPEDLTPYTEPRKESCDKCMNEAEDLAYQLYSVKVDEAYQRGLNDAWNAARKIVLSREDGGLFSYEERKAVFGCGNYMALKTFLAPEAIKKIRQYEQEQKDFKVGDEVTQHIKSDGLNPAYDEKAIILSDTGSGSYYVVYSDGLTAEVDVKELGGKTGRHFPEIAEVLRKMQEEKE